MLKYLALLYDCNTGPSLVSDAQAASSELSQITEGKQSKATKAGQVNLNASQAHQVPSILITVSVKPTVKPCRRLLSCFCNICSRTPGKTCLFPCEYFTAIAASPLGTGSVTPSSCVRRCLHPLCSNIRCARCSLIKCCLLPHANKGCRYLHPCRISNNPAAVSTLLALRLACITRQQAFCHLLFSMAFQSCCWELRPSRQAHKAKSQKPCVSS